MVDVVFLTRGEKYTVSYWDVRRLRTASFGLKMTSCHVSRKIVLCGMTSFSGRTTSSANVVFLFSTTIVTDSTMRRFRNHDDPRRHLDVALCNTATWYDHLSTNQIKGARLVKRAAHVHTLNRMSREAKKINFPGFIEEKKSS